MSMYNLILSNEDSKKAVISEIKKKTKTLKNGCLKWESSYNKYHKPIIKFKNKDVLVDKLVLMLNSNDLLLLDNMSVSRKDCCEVGYMCVNPEHLKISDHAYKASDNFKKLIYKDEINTNFDNISKEDHLSILRDLSYNVYIKDINDIDSCWLWNNGKLKRPYFKHPENPNYPTPIVKYGLEKKTQNRVESLMFLLLHNVHIPSNTVFYKSCGCGSCVRPSHIKRVQLSISSFDKPDIEIPNIANIIKTMQTNLNKYIRSVTSTYFKSYLYQSIPNIFYKDTFTNCTVVHKEPMTLEVPTIELKDVENLNPPVLSNLVETKDLDYIDIEKCELFLKHGLSIEFILNKLNSKYNNLNKESLTLFLQDLSKLTNL